MLDFNCECFAAVLADRVGRGARLPGGDGRGVAAAHVGARTPAARVSRREGVLLSTSRQLQPCDFVENT